MSLTDKVVKNSFYYLLSQTIGFILPLILTPLIISQIGESGFGIYAIILGFTGVFGVLDLSISSSFIKFISEYYIQEKFQKLNSFINTGFTYYLGFALILGGIGFVWAEAFIGLFNISGDVLRDAVTALRLSMVSFVLSSITTVFTCILFSRHQIYRTSVPGIVLHFLYFGGVLYLLFEGFGLTGLFIAQTGFAFLILLLNAYMAKKAMPEYRFSLFKMDRDSLKKMFTYGTQIQVSRISAIISEKFDEFLLGYFTVLTNVTFFNVAAKVTRAGRFLPLQFIPQIGSAASELQAREDKEKLSELFESFTRYMSLLVIPIYLFIFLFSGMILSAWLGEGYEISSLLLKVLAAGQLLNFIFSVPGNTILSGIGLPKYAMYEGLINLALNIILSYVLIMYYGVTGAAIGSSIAWFFSSLYIYRSSLKYFNRQAIRFSVNVFFIPLINGLVSTGLIYFITQVLFADNFMPGRIELIIALILAFALIGLLYMFGINKSNYLREQDRNLIRMTMGKIPLLKRFSKNAVINGEK